MVEFPFGKPVAFVSRSTKTLPRLYVHSGTMLIRAMESGAALRLDAQLPQTRHAMGISRRELPGIRKSRMPPHDAQTFMRPLLDSVMPLAQAECPNWW